MTTTQQEIRKVSKFCVGDVKTTFEPQEGYEFLEVKNYHGDRDEIWIEIYNEKGNLMGRWNCRFVLGIDYAQVPD